MKGSRNNNKKRVRTVGTQTPIMRVERMDHPPQINSYQVCHNRTLRFTSLATASTNISFQNLLDTMLVATSATAGFDLFEFVKIDKIEIWALAALGTPSTVEVNFTTATGDANVHTDTSLGVKPAYVKAVPARKSLASFYQLSNAGNAFQLTAPAGSIIDIKMRFKSSSFAPQAAQNALVAATTGEFYWRGLDGIAMATTNYPPPAGVQKI